MKKAKAQRRTEEKTVLILSCAGCYALCRRPDTGLLAGLWEFPNVPGILEAEDAVKVVESHGGRVKEILRQVEKKHIFTHIQWNMRGIYLEVREKTERFFWMNAETIRRDAALPTAFRQFFPEENRE